MQYNPYRDVMFICKMQMTLTSVSTGLITVKINSTFYQAQIIFPNERVCLQGQELLSHCFSSLIDLSALDIHSYYLRRCWPLAMVPHHRMKLLKCESSQSFDYHLNLIRISAQELQFYLKFRSDLWLSGSLASLCVRALKN